MVTLHIADGAMAFLSATPGYKIPMDFFLIAWQCNPQFENITQKDQILAISLKRFKHLEKNRMISYGFANMGIRDDDHFIIHTLKAIRVYNPKKGHIDAGGYCNETSTGFEKDPLYWF